MKYDEMILNKLLDKYEKSNHFFEVGKLNRRVILICDKKTLPKIDPENTKVYKEFLSTLYTLQNKKYIDVEWVRKDVLAKKIFLNLDKLDEIYQYIQRQSKRKKIDNVCSLIAAYNANIKTNWINNYLQSSLESIKIKKNLSGIWTSDFILVENILKVLDYIDNHLDENIAIRVLSIKLFSDSKYFEHNLKGALLSIIRQNVLELSDLDEIEDREVFAQVGIIMTSEIFEFCGNVSFEFETGIVNFSPMKKGSCINGNCAADIRAINFNKIKEVIFVENRTNYSDMCLKNNNEITLIVYHGGFYSPQKKVFFERIYQNAKEISKYFWGDIDLGGFKMYNRLKSNIMPDLIPINMNLEDYNKYKDNGLKKTDEYLKRLQKLLGNDDYKHFEDVILAIIENKVTVEHECFIL